MTHLIRYFKPYVWALLLLVLCVFGQTYANLSLPDYTARIINEGIVGLDRDSIYRNGLLMLMFSLIGGAFMIAVGYLAARIATGFTMKLRDEVFSKVEQFSLREFNQFSTASLITRCTNDLQQIQTVLVMLLRMALMAPIMGIWAIYKAYNLAPSMTWIMAAAIGALIVVIAFLFIFVLPRLKLLQGLVDRLNLVTREILTGLRVIRAFNKEASEEQKFSEVNSDLTDVNLFVNRLLAIMQPSMLLILNVTSVAIVWVGASKIDTGALQIGDMLAFIQFAMQSIFAFLMISIVFIMAPRAAVSANRVVEVLETTVTITDPERPVASTKGGHGSLVFDDVTFAYPGAEVPVLQHISFTANSGETTAIIGSTGSGKSTLVNLIPRFYDVTSGRILIDGVDIRQIRLNDLYEKIGYVPQKTVLFSGTVASNLRYGAPDTTDAELHESAAVAQAAAICRSTRRAIRPLGRPRRGKFLWRAEAASFDRPRHRPRPRDFDLRRQFFRTRFSNRVQFASGAQADDRGQHHCGGRPTHQLDYAGRQHSGARCRSHRRPGHAPATPGRFRDLSRDRVVPIVR